MGEDALLIYIIDSIIQYTMENEAFRRENEYDIGFRLLCFISGRRQRSATSMHYSLGIEPKFVCSPV